jgi:O-antigen/teichoic acid export membrane protein
VSQETNEYGPGDGRLRDHAARGAAWSMLAQTSIRVSGLVTFVILARLLAPEDFGAIALASTLVLALTVVADFGFSAYLVHVDRADQRTLSTAFWLNALAGLLLALGLVAISWPLSELVRAPQAAPVIAAVSLSVVLDSLRGVSAALLRRRFDFKALALRMLAATTVGQITAVVMAVAGAGVWALVGQVWAANLVATLWVWRAARWRPSMQFSSAAARAMGSYGVHVVSATLVIQVSAWATNGLISRYLGIQQLGYYAMAMRVVTMVVDSAHQAAGQFATPMLASVKGQRERLVQAYLSGQALITAVGVPVLAALAINADLLIPAVLGAKWIDAVPTFQFLALAGMGRVVGWTVNSQLLVAIGEVRTNNVLSVASSLLLVGAAFVAAQHSLTAVAAVTAAISVGFIPVMIAAVSRALKISAARTVWSVVRVVGVAGLAALPAWGTTMVLAGRVPGLLAAAISIAVYGLAHLALLRLVEPRLWYIGTGMASSLVGSRRPRSRRKPVHPLSD